MIAFDSDAASKPEVRRAEYKLAELLGAAGARVRVLRLEPLPGGEKCGIDDFLVACGPEVFGQATSAELDIFVRRCDASRLLPT